MSACLYDCVEDRRCVLHIKNFLETSRSFLKHLCLIKIIAPEKSFTGSNQSGSDSGSFMWIVKSSQVIVWSLKSSMIPSSLMIS